MLLVVSQAITTFYLETSKPATIQRNLTFFFLKNKQHRWGPIVETTESRQRQQLYLSEQTDGSEPNKLVIVTADIAKPRISSAEAISTWSEQSPSPWVSSPTKTLVHPGEVNKILNLPNHTGFIVTHSDSPLVYVWNLGTQPDRASDLASSNEDRRKPSTADLILEGHTDNAEFALGTSTAEPLVASGGKDTNVLIWNLADSSLFSSGGKPTRKGAGASLDARIRLKGHSDTVNDVSFVPGSASELASVSDDSSILLWDTRSGTAPSHTIGLAHGKTDVHCCDWSPLRAELLVTGAADGTVKVWDRRNFAEPLISLSHHSGAVTNVEWSAHSAPIFASGDDDGLLCIWNVDKKGPEADGPAATKRLKIAAPPQLVFQHAGHQLAVVDFCWNPQDPWSVMSVSDDASGAGGGTLQVWRVSDLIYKPEEEILAELEPYREFIVTGNEEKLPGRGPPAEENGDGDGNDGKKDAMAVDTPKVEDAGL